MVINVPSKGAKFCLALTINTRREQRMRIIATAVDESGNKIPYSEYINRTVKVKGSAPFHLEFPQSPERMKIFIYNVANGNKKEKEDQTFFVNKYKVEKLQTCFFIKDADTRNFLPFAQKFCAQAGYLALDEYRSSNGQFKIMYQDTIRDANGKEMMTPASVGHKSKRIKVARDKFITYTIPQRLVILLHEKGHVYDNPKNGKAITDESSADLAGLKTYLSLGYPRHDAKYVFAKVFYGAQTKLNLDRLAKIDEYVTKFDNGEIKGSCKYQFPK